ncbi:MAG: [FeFe] hydrogenase H-cluster radical SAM maturase HydE [Ignavibacteria bacterium]|jgi:biotin synthase|nr:[FeFe] hydrogenase H-cluster radical SAM maturase HydE [Ignavibacteria bacterium]
MELDYILSKDKLDFAEICYLLAAEKENEIEKIRSHAENILLKTVGNEVALRGLIEFSNYCTRDCYYCGIRKSNYDNARFMLSEEEIYECAIWAMEKNFASLVLQSGERDDEQFIDFVVKVIKNIKKKTTTKELPQGLGITLSVGEQTFETYKRFFDAGAHRYLLRIETTNTKLFKELHPKEQTIEKRINCLEHLKDIGFQVGTGVMIGFPNQTVEDLARDIMFFKEIDVDMVGMGPFIPHHSTPYAKYDFDKDRNIQLALKMIAVLRITMPYINIASTTALETLSKDGRALGLTYGANVVMPQLTPVSYKNKYLLYDNKPDIDEQQEAILEMMKKSFSAINRKIAFGKWGDSLHFQNKTQI